MGTRGCITGGGMMKENGGKEIKQKKNQSFQIRA